MTESYNRHGRVIARFRVHADGYAVMSLEIEVPSPDIAGLVENFLNDQKQRPRKTGLVRDL